jgi:hypothetical protein
MVPYAVALEKIVRGTLLTCFLLKILLLNDLWYALDDRKCVSDNLRSGAKSLAFSFVCFKFVCSIYLVV